MAVGHAVEGEDGGLKCLVEVLEVVDGLCIDDPFEDVPKDAVSSFDQANSPVSFSRNHFQPYSVALEVLLEVKAIVGARVSSDRSGKSIRPEPQVAEDVEGVV